MYLQHFHLVLCRAPTESTCCMLIDHSREEVYLWSSICLLLHEPSPYDVHADLSDIWSGSMESTIEHLSFVLCRILRQSTYYMLIDHGGWEVYLWTSIRLCRRFSYDVDGILHADLLDIFPPGSIEPELPTCLVSGTGDWNLSQWLQTVSRWATHEDSMKFVCLQLCTIE